MTTSLASAVTSELVKEFGTLYCTSSSFTQTCGVIGVAPVIPELTSDSADVVGDTGEVYFGSVTKTNNYALRKKKPNLETVILSHITGVTNKRIVVPAGVSESMLVNTKSTEVTSGLSGRINVTISSFGFTLYTSKQFVKF